MIDFVEDYKKSSQKRHNQSGASNVSSIPSTSSFKGIEEKEKSLGDILNLKFDDV